MKRSETNKAVKLGEAHSSPAMHY